MIIFYSIFLFLSFLMDFFIFFFIILLNFYFIFIYFWITEKLWKFLDLFLDDLDSFKSF